MYENVDETMFPIDSWIEIILLWALLLMKRQEVILNALFCEAFNIVIVESFLYDSFYLNFELKILKLVPVEINITPPLSVAVLYSN